jgi:hypothetical protein
MGTQTSEDPVTDTSASLKCSYYDVTIRVRSRNMLKL